MLSLDFVLGAIWGIWVGYTIAPPVVAAVKAVCGNAWKEAKLDRAE
jgi:hypothetical protein